MMNDKLYIHHGWTLTGYGEDGKRIEPISAAVPGHVHTDLLRHGLIESPMWRDQALTSQWVEKYDWTYETEFEWPGTEGTEAIGTETGTETVVLHFEGLDTLADVFLNSMLIGSADNMFISHSFAIEDSLVVGTNHLKVHFTSVTRYLADKDITKYASLFSQDRAFMRKIQCTFGWDWVARLVSYGIWRPVYIQAKPEGIIADTALRTLKVDSGGALLEWEVELSGLKRDSILQIELQDAAGNVVWQVEQEIVRSGTEAIHSRGSFILNQPRLWWPAGYGKPNLYSFRVLILADRQKLIDEKTIEIGIRTIEIEQIPDAQGSSFTIVVNGQRIFAKGGNWVPADPFPSAVTEEKYTQVLQTVVDGNMNMLRVWGGGTYELPAFWAVCNRLGIMVSMDFMMACSEYPEKEEWFLQAMEREVHAVVKELRNHPSLIFWCGDNELAMNNNQEDDYSGKIIFAKVTEPICGKLDPNRPLFPTSPIYGRPFNSEDEGDCHVSAWYDPAFYFTDMSDYRERITRLRGRFLSESANAGAPPLSSLLKMMTIDDVLDETGSMWEFRTNDNPYNGLDDLTHYRMVEACALRIFGESADPLLKVKKLGYVHYEYLRLTAEHLRRRKYNSSGLLFWMYNDCWPASGWALVDYYGYPKAGYYGAKKGFSPLLVSVEDCGDELAVWLVNDTLYPFQGQVTVRSASTSGEEHFSSRIETGIGANSAAVVGVWNKADIGMEARSANVVFSAEWIGEKTFTVEQSDIIPNLLNHGHDRTVYYDCMPKDLTLSPATLTVRWEPVDAASGYIHIAADVFARVVTVEDELLLDDNYFDLMPSDSRTIAYRTKDGTPWNTLKQVTCWNEKKQAVSIE